MIYNATLLRVDARLPATAGGDLAFTTGGSIAVRCAIDGAKQSQGWTVEQLRQASDATLIVRAADVPAGVSIATGARVVLRLDRQTASRTYQVHATTDRVKGDMTHAMYLLRSE